MQRTQALSLLARAEPALLQRFVDRHQQQVPEYRIVQPAEIGLMMVRGRIGGCGQPFNFGEVTVSRCTVLMRTGELGRGVRLGRNKPVAFHLALLDALLQIDFWQRLIYSQLLQALQESHDAERQQASRKADETRVEFMTMVRGE